MKEITTIAFPLYHQYIKKLESKKAENELSAYKKLIEICQAVKNAGGFGLLVGGCVRDILLGHKPKDFDLEIFHLSPEKVEEIVSQHGRVIDIGRAFGILRIVFGEGVDIDVALPRTDSKVTEGHRGFEVKADPFMSVDEAAKRRDFTINSISADPLTGEIFDPFAGISDLENKILRVTDLVLFCDDPLRVLRGMQFAARFGLQAEPKTKEIMTEMVPDINQLAKERILDEWKKLFLSPKPSVGLELGHQIGLFEKIYPEFDLLSKTKQEPEWHPEGNVWQHTLMAVDQAAVIAKREKLNEKETLVLLISAFCHDLGKQTTTSIKNNRIISHGHEKAGSLPTQTFLEKIGLEKTASEKIISLVANHLAPSELYRAEQRGQKITDGAIYRLARRIYPATIEELVLLAEADCIGRDGYNEINVPPFCFAAGGWLLNKARMLKVSEELPKDIITGKDLFDMGFMPGPDFSKVIKLANGLREETGLKREEIIFLIKDKKINEAIEILKSKFSK